MNSKKSTTIRNAKVTTATRKASFNAPKARASRQAGLDIDLQYDILDIVSNIKRSAVELDSYGDNFWRWADRIGQIIEDANK